MKVSTFEYYARRFGKRCYYCGETLKACNATRDHYIPKQFGGKGNIKLSCVKCNSMKANMLPHAYLERIRVLFFNYYQKELISI